MLRSLQKIVKPLPNFNLDCIIRACSLHGNDEKLYKIVVRQTEGKKPLGRSGHRWEDTIEMDFKEWKGVD
jgi:hypothetical protein